MSLNAIIDRFASVKVLVAGDVMLDRYWWGSVNRISPEAPVPVVRINETTITAGGAANVAANIAGLGAGCFLLGAIGNDEEGSLFPEVLEGIGLESRNLLKLDSRPTTTKSRIVASGQHIVRLDQEDSGHISPEEEDLAIGVAQKLIPESDILIISDYAKGFLTDSLTAKLIETAKKAGKPILVDPKGKSYQKYSGADLITPNRKEALEAAGLDERVENVVEVAGVKLLNANNLAAVLITQGKDGMTLFEKGAKSIHLDSRARKVYDVTGAGDTVIATLGTAIGAGAGLHEAAKLANAAAGLVVEQAGTSAISLGQLKEIIT